MWKEPVSTRPMHTPQGLVERKFQEFVNAAIKGTPAWPTREDVANAIAKLEAERAEMLEGLRPQKRAAGWICPGCFMIGSSAECLQHTRDCSARALVEKIEGGPK